MTDKKTLFIEGKEVEFTDESNLLEVIRNAGLNVPTFCYRPDLKPFGSCRMCVVEIEGRGIQSSCTMPPEAGLKVHLNTEKTRRIRKTVLELLLASHDRECTTCDKSGQCELQKYSDEYGADQQKFAGDYNEYPINFNHPYIEIDNNKCILCSRCVRICKDVVGANALGLVNRGFKTYVAPSLGDSLTETNCESCGLCISTCPTGKALPAATPTFRWVR